MAKPGWEEHLNQQETSLLFHLIMAHSDSSNHLSKELNTIPALGSVKILAFSISTVKDSSSASL